MDVHESKKKIRAKHDVGASGTKKRSTEVPDTGSERRKRQVLHQRMVGSQPCLDDQMKTFFQETLESSLASFQTSFEKSIEDKFGDRLGKIEAELVEVKQLLSTRPMVATTSIEETPPARKQQKGKTSKPPTKAVQTKTRVSKRLASLP